MSTDNSKKNIVDEAARARKALAKNAAWQFNSHNVRRMELQTPNDTRVGEHAVLCMVGPYGAKQYTICRPIGITELADDDWIMIPTDQILATLARRDDPKAEEINRSRTIYRNELAAKEKLIKIDKASGNPVVYYVSDGDTPRNAHLKQAKTAQKARLASLKEDLSKKKKGDEFEKQKLNSQIQKADNLLGFLPEEIRTAESKLQKFVSDPKIEEKVCKKHPYTHRTRVGPYGDQDQVAIKGTRGFPLADVVGAVNKLLDNLDLSSQLGQVQPTGKPKPPRKNKRRGRYKGKGQSKAAPTPS